MAQKYISDLLKTNECNCLVRCATNYKLRIPKTNNETCGDRASVKAAPALWSALPEHIQSTDKINTFKNKLKTHLFNCYYTNT